jgi:hypothetical protein
MIAQAIESYGRLDVLVNNAGILRDRMLVNMTEAEWDAVIKVHLKGTFAPAHHAAAYWRDRAKRGEQVDARIINTTSVSGIYGNAGQTNYGAAKAGIATFTIIAARELGRYGITVNAIAPGALTRLTEDLGMGRGTDEEKARLHPRWVAPIVTWLASTRSSHVTGRVSRPERSSRCRRLALRARPLVRSDPNEIGPIVDELVRVARKNAGMNGRDLTELSARRSRTLLGRRRARRSPRRCSSRQSPRCERCSTGTSRGRCVPERGGAARVRVAAAIGAREWLSVASRWSFHRETPRSRCSPLPSRSLRNNRSAHGDRLRSWNGDRVEDVSVMPHARGVRWERRVTARIQTLGGPKKRSSGDTGAS